MDKIANDTLNRLVRENLELRGQVDALKDEIEAIKAIDEVRERYHISQLKGVIHADTYLAYMDFLKMKKSDKLPDSYFLFKNLETVFQTLEKAGIFKSEEQKE